MPKRRRVHGGRDEEERKLEEKEAKKIVWHRVGLGNWATNLEAVLRLLLTSALTALPSNPNCRMLTTTHIDERKIIHLDDGRKNWTLGA